jgi:hypothetical protein
MALATWWRTDSLPALPVIPGFHAAICDDDALMAELNRIPLEDVRARRQDGHRPYVAYLHGTPVAYGWAATRVASIEFEAAACSCAIERQPSAVPLA